MLTLLIAASLTADDPVGADVRKALAAREKALKGATWKFRVKQRPNAAHVLQDMATEGTVQLSDGAIAVETAEAKGRVRRIQSPTDEWTETASTAGKKVDVTKAKSKSVREDHAFKTAEMLALAVAGRYGPLSKYLESAMAEKRPEGVVRFTVAETQRERATQRLEFDFESKAPFRLKEFRLFEGDDKSFEYFRNQEFGEVGGQWYVKQSGVGRSTADDKAAERTLEIAEFQATSTPIEYAKLEASIATRYATPGDPTGKANRAGQGVGGGGFGGPQKGGAQKKGGGDQKGGGQKSGGQKGGAQKGGGGPQSSMPPPSSGKNEDPGKGRFDASRFAWVPVAKAPPIVQWILPASCAAAALGLVMLLRRRPV